MLPVTFQLPVAIILLCGGLLACFLGYRLFRFVLGVYGLLLGAILAVQLVGPEELWATVATAIVGGIGGVLVFLAAYYVGVALVGAALADVWGVTIGDVSASTSARAREVFGL